MCFVGTCVHVHAYARVCVLNARICLHVCARVCAWGVGWVFICLLCFSPLSKFVVETCYGLNVRIPQIRMLKS